MTVPPIIADAADQLRLLAEALYDPTDLLEVRAIWPDRGRGAKSTWVRAADLAIPKSLTWMRSRNAEGAGVYISANPRTSDGGRDAESVALARSLVVDFDGGVTSTAALARAAEAGLPPPTAAVHSGHGVHLYWRLRDPITDLELWTGHQKALINLLGTDGCIHDPPRVMRLPGFWNTKSEPVECRLLEADGQRAYDIAVFPQPVLVAPPAVPNGSSDGAHRGEPSPATLRFIALGAGTGSRNNLLFTAACDLAGCGYTQAEAEEKLVGPAVASPGDHPFTEEEAKAAIASAFSKARTPVIAAEPWTEPLPLLAGSPPPFPIREAFPPALWEVRDYLAAVAEELQVPVDLPAMLLLPVVTVAVSQKVEVQPRDGWREVPPLWTLSLLPPSERKSPAFTRLMRPVHIWQREEAERLEPQIAAFKESRRIDEKRLEDLRRKAAKGDNPSREDAIELAKTLDAQRAPALPAFVISDATTEAVCEVLVQNRERAIVASTEADALDVMMGRYSEKGQPNMGVWLKAYSGDPESVRRRGRPPEHLNRPTLSVGLTVQPESVRGMFASRAAKGRGLLARFLTSAPLSRVGRRKTGGAAVPVPEHLHTHYLLLVKRLLRIAIPEDGPLVVEFSPEAAALFNGFETRLEPELARGGLLGDRADWGGKLCGTLARIALALHMMQVWGAGPGDSAHCAHSAPSEVRPIDAATMRAALAWMPYLLDHERHVAGLMGCDPATSLADGLLMWLQRTDASAFTRREAFTKNRSVTVRQVEDVDPALALLEELGYIRRRPAPSRPPGQAGQPPSPTFDVNPLWDRKRGGS